MNKQVKSRQRVADHGEVFTAEREVKAMCDLVLPETQRIDSRFLDKAVARLIQGIPQKGLISGLFADGRPMRSYFFALPPGAKNALGA